MSEKNLKVSIAGIEFKNPVTTASGTFASGREYSDFYDISQLGAITTKGVSDKPWKGNPPPRIAECWGGMLNSVGLQNNGVEAFIKDDIPFLQKLGTRVIVNVCGHTIEEYCSVITALADQPVDFLELNISCPNISAGGISFGTDAKMAERVVKAAKACAKQPLIVKLSPNVTNISDMAKAAESAGADAISMINTLLGMKIDIRTRKPLLGNKTGGLSGPAIKPVAVRMVYEVYKSIKLPIIGMGGIMNGDDAIEFILAGAAMVAVGMAVFNDPYSAISVLEGIKGYMNKYGVKDINELRGAAVY